MTTPAQILPDHLVIDPSVFVASNATLVGTVTIGADASIWFGVVIRADMAPVIIGQATNIQDNSVIHVDHGKPTRLGERVTVGHRAIVHGATVESDVIIGMGAIVLNEAVVGAESIIGAGAVVTERAKIPPRSLVLGMPGRVVREITPEERAYIERAAAAYVRYGRHYRQKRVGVIFPPAEPPSTPGPLSPPPV